MNAASSEYCTIVGRNSTPDVVALAHREGSTRRLSLPKASLAYTVQYILSEAHSYSIVR